MAGFILGILSIIILSFGLFLGIVGLVISLIAQKEIEKSMEQGGKLAKAGVILSIIGIVLQLFLTIIGIASLFLVTPG
ncbi:DUF4190 domain-containing protein [Alkalicoccus daliensis]|uniref:DUF4190 domain-containing protein n=1 Tax=Alkalicoccus daliensis TaxID=745820 RepID=UPI00244E749E|nr:DUF4190 domain-containing protein [Alkalicoccus daliensis]